MAEFKGDCNQEQALADFLKKEAEERKKATVVTHRRVVKNLEQPEPALSHEEIIADYQKRWSEVDVNQTHESTSTPIYLRGTRLRIRRSIEGMLIIEVPRWYVPKDEKLFDDRWVYDQNGRLIKRYESDSYCHKFEYDIEGYLVRTTRMNYAGCGYESVVEREGGKVVKIATQYFKGKGSYMKRGENDGEAIITTFQTV